MKRSQGEDVTIRPMRLEDLESVLEVDHLSFASPWPESGFRFELLENDASLLLVAEEKTEGGGTQVLGYVVIWMIVDEAHIATIAVHPEHRREGLGRVLLQAGLEEAAQQGMQSATLEVRAGNQAAQRLYEEFGFRVVGRRYRYYRDNLEDAIIMTLERMDQKNK